MIFVNSLFFERHVWHFAHVFDPKFLVSLGKVVDMFVGDWTGVQTAGHSFAKEPSTEMSTLSLRHRHESICCADDVSCTRMVVLLGVINLVGK